MLISGRRRHLLGQQVTGSLMAALRERDVQLARQQQLRHVAAAAAGGADADQIDRAMADVVVTVPGEIFSGKFPIARNAPLLNAAQNLGAAVAAVPGVEGQVEIAHEIAQIFEEGRRFGVPGGPYRALVMAPRTPLEKIPGEFRYQFRCAEVTCRGHRIMCTDWEMGESYRRWRDQYGERWEAMFRQRYERDMMEKEDTHFYDGNRH